MKAIIIIVFLLTLTPAAVANRCAGEAQFAIEFCACTVHNRLRAGWNPSKVLSAYHAPDSHATPSQVALVAAVLDGRAACNPDFYFIYGKGDVIALGLGRYTPVLVVRQGDKEVRFYSRWFRSKSHE